MKIALAGNPNSGKTTLFNSITGKIENVGNWAGVTVDKKEGQVREELNRSDRKIIAIDLPGSYSMSPFTNEESITSDFIKEENPDVIINIVDATNLSRSLFFTTQLLELGIPVVIALNKSDMLEKKETKINVTRLKELLNCPVVLTSAIKSNNNGLALLVQEAVNAGISKSQQNEYNGNGGHHHHRNRQQNLNFPKKQGNRNAYHKGGCGYWNNNNFRLPNASCPNIPHTKEEYKKIDERRFVFVKKVVGEVERRKISSSQQTKQDKIDRIIAHRWLGIPIFAAIIWLVFSISQAWIGPWLADFLVGFIDSFYGLVEGVLGSGVNPVLKSLLLDGIIGGVGALIGFLPLIMVLFFCLALLEDCGYMARVAVVMDRFFKKIGLSGKSIIPMVVGTGCSVPGIMATRTIKDERQRKTTAMLTPFMPCGAKLPIIALFAGLFFDGQGWVGTLMYFVAIIIIIVSGLVIKKITNDTTSYSYFIIELPEYRWPSIKRAILLTLNRAKSFIIKAGTVILVCNAIIHLLQTFNWQFEVVAEGASQTSILASIASPIAVLLIPLGFGMWQFAAAAITGFIAKENVIGTLAVTFAVTNFINVDESALVGGANEVSTVFGIGAVAALAFLVYTLFSPPCVAAIAAMNTELESRKWFWGGLAFQLGMGYTTAFIVYQFGTLITTGSFGDSFVAGLIAVSVMIGIVVYLMNRGSKETVVAQKKAA